MAIYQVLYEFMSTVKKKKKKTLNASVLLHKIAFYSDVMDFESSVECHQSTSSSLSTTSSTVPAPKTPTVSHCGQSTSNKKQSLVDLQKQLLMKEMEKMEMEMEVMELKKEKLKEEIHLLKLKKEKLISEQ